MEENIFGAKETVSGARKEESKGVDNCTFWFFGDDDSAENDLQQLFDIK